MKFVSAVFFVHATTPVRIYFRVALLAVAAFGIWLAAKGDGSDSALACLLVIQMFAVSTGFRSHATRGYYDVLLTRLPRPALALSHAIAAALPGALAWISIAAAQIAAARSVHVLALSLPSLAAFLLVSIVAWSISVPFGPLTGGSLWLASAVAALAGGGALHLVGLMRGAGSGFSWERLAVAVAFPPFLMGAPVTLSELAFLAGVAFLFLLAACVYVGKTSFPLREDS